MTTHRKASASASLGPLFSWSPTVRTVRDGSGRSDGQDDDSPGKTRTSDRPAYPDGSGRSTVRTARDGVSEKANDFSDRPAVRISPLKGEEHPDGPLAVPSESSAALPLRSQRTDPGDKRDPDPEQQQKADNAYKLQPPIGRAPTLRPYQVDSLAAIDGEYARGIRRTLAVLATGLGKTVLFAEWARRRVAIGRRVLVLAHRTELLEQAQRKLEDVGLHAAIEQAEKRAGRAPVVVASVQTLRGKRLAQFDPTEFDIVIDEAHHTNAAGYRAIIDHFTGALVLGVTATPDRGDGQALGDVFETCAFRFEIREGIAGGFLVPIRARQVHVEGVDLSTVRSRAGDLASDELAAIMSQEQAVLGVVDPLLREAGDRRTILFAVDVAHALAITEAINRYRPGAATAGYGELDRDERSAILASFRRGEFQFLVNCQLWTEGFDEPSISCVATARPTKSRALVVQCVGRGTRLLGRDIDESRRNGKSDLLWLDFTGNAGRHKLVGPLDALAAGDIADDIRKEAARLLAEGDHDIDEVLDEAERQLEERRRAAKITASARYFAAEVDPFFGEELGPPCIEPWANEPATQEQRDVLLDIGMKKLATATTLTRGEAVRVIGAHLERRRLGLCSFKQAKTLARLGVDTKTMTKAQASARIGILATCDWDLARARPRLAQLEATEMLKNNERNT